MDPLCDPQPYPAAIVPRRGRSGAVVPTIVREIHQIELSSRCNLRCVYCIQPTMARPKLDMTRETWDQALDWVRFFVRAGTQATLALSVTGESTLHPDFVAWVYEARAVIGWDRSLEFATNGLLVDDAMARALAPAKPSVTVSLHRPERAQAAIQGLDRYGLLASTSCHAATAPHNWGGQIDWPNLALPMVCPWLSVGWAAVLAYGRLASCCYEGDTAGILGHVAEEPRDDLLTRPNRLCEACWHVPPQTVDQAAGAREFFLKLWPPGVSQPEMFGVHACH